MLKIKKYWILPALIALGLAIPAGISNKILPSTLVSSMFDEDRVNIPTISIQTLFLVVYCLWNSQFVRIGSLQLIMVVMLVFTTLVCSIFSIYPAGFLSYSTTWLIAPFAVAIHCRRIQNQPEVAFSATMSMVAYMFIPFYIFDFLISLHSFGLDNFASYTLATNGHTFVSMLFVLLIQFDIISRRVKFRIISYKAFALIIYTIGGVVSQGRVALVFMLLSTIVLHWRYAKKMLILGMIFFASLITYSDKIRLVFDAVLVADFQDPIVWSSLISRLSFWEVFFNIFEKNPVAGAGGLSANIIKYDYGFPYSVFVDPHNEIIFILSGFGLSGCLFILISIILTRSLLTKQLNWSGNWSKPVDRSGSIIILCFIVGCSLTNANSAKQNIEILICLTILFAITEAKKLKYHRVGHQTI
jgi:O-antigen ligase